VLAGLLAAGGGGRGPASDRATAAVAPPRRTPRPDPQGRAIDRLVEAEVAVGHADDRVRAVALTFDDGPGRDTMAIVRALRALRARGTFYVIGRQIDEEPEALRAIVRSGSAIGNHTWSHPDLRTLSDEAIREQVAATRDAIRRVAGVDAVTLRPPYGGLDTRVLGALAPLGLATVLWDLDPDDWRGLPADAITRHVLDEAHPGSIILLHDGGGDRAQTLAALPAIVRGLRARGYRLMTVPQLLAAAPPSGASLVRARGAGPD
jgi:peptidoglycan-N-acetylglucosamine deacetylase